MILGTVSQTYVVYTLLSLISISLAKDIPAFYIFGDSGVDVGNNFYINTFARPVFPNGIDFGNKFGTPSGRYSNGRVYVDHIAQELGLKNFPPPYLAPTTVGDILLKGTRKSFEDVDNDKKPACNLKGGRISLETQVRYFERTTQAIISNIGIKAAKKLLAGAIYIVAIGGNDVSTPDLNGPLDLASQDLRLDTIISMFRSQLGKLYMLGARKIVVINSSPAGCLPFVRDVYAMPDGCVSFQNQIAQLYNSKLKGMLEELTKNLTGSQYVYADNYAMIEDVIQNYISYGAGLIDTSAVYIEALT
ncbi:unnamed protein product [Dovyalis caffra]|uniref:GDSL esterase/lipase n=1 Tax=Dovyalis caffra TaxID=77055 RepID=A0AAV1REZ7_9ROSI|nr:unnamed protein product [Dovyalis caffra]